MLQLELIRKCIKNKKVTTDNRKISLEKAKKRIEELESELLKIKSSKSDLIESELRFELLTEIAPVGIFRTNANGLTNYVNPQWCRISGISANQAMKNGWLDAVHPDDKNAIFDNWLEKTAVKERSTAQYRFVKPDGTISWVIGKAIPIRDKKGKISGYIGTITDITRIKKAEESLNKKLKSEILLSSVSSEFINTDSNNIDDVINNSLKKIGIFTNVDRSYVFLFSEDKNTVNNTHEWVNKGIKPEKSNLQKISTTETKWWISKLVKSKTIQISRLCDMPKAARVEKEMLESQNIKSILIIPMISSNQLIGWLGFDSVKEERIWQKDETIMLKILAETFVNALNRVRAEHLKRRSEERNKAIVSLLPDLYFSLNKDGIFLDGATQKKEDFLLPVEDFIGKNITDVLPEYVADLASENIKKAFDTNNVRIFNYPLVVNRQELLYEARLVPSGKEEILVIVRDITDYLKQQRELEQKNEELERYAYTVSHDLKSPVVTVKGFAALLKEELKDLNNKKVKNDLDRIINASDRMSKMLGELLEISRAGKITGKKEKVPLKNIIDEVLEIMAIPIMNSNAKIIVHENLPIINTDKNRIKDVIQNLIENSLKFSKKNTQTIIEIGIKKQDNKRVICVKDNGIGIEPEFQERVFGLFSKLNPAINGSGIGLPLVKKIIESLNGRIWIESEGKNKGTTICFYVTT